jgi:hypothetical protein
MIQNRIKISFLQQGGQSSEEMMTHPTILLPSSIAGQFSLDDIQIDLVREKTNLMLNEFETFNDSNYGVVLPPYYAFKSSTE